MILLSKRLALLDDKTILLKEGVYAICGNNAKLKQTP